MNVQDFIRKYRGCSFDMMTPGGFVYLTAEQAEELLAGKDVKANPGDPEYAMPLDAEILLSERVLTANWEKGVCHMMTEYMKESEDHKEGKGMEAHDKEQKVIARLKTGYEAYIEKLKNKPASELIEMAPEIAAAKFIMEEMSVEGAFTEYAPYLLQMKDPFETLKTRWLSEHGGDHHEELDHLLWRMSESGQNQAAESAPEGEDGAYAVRQQEVSMC